MITVMNQVFVGETECVETLTFDNIEDLIKYYEYMKEQEH